MTLSSFFRSYLDSSLDYLQNALDRISSWMTANLLTLNSSKTEFLLIGLSKQLAKINNSPPLTLLETWASYLMNTSLFLTRSHLSPKSCYYHIRQLRHFHCSLQARLLQLSITTCASFRSPGSNRSRTLLCVLLSKLPNPVTSLLSSGLYTG